MKRQSINLAIYFFSFLGSVWKRDFMLDLQYVLELERNHDNGEEPGGPDSSLAELSSKSKVNIV